MEGSPPPPRFSESIPRFTENLPGSHSPPSPPYQAYPHLFPEQQRYSNNAPEATEAPFTPIQHRLSNKDRPMSPEIMSPGLESVRSDEGEKEVYSQPQPDARDVYNRQEEPSRICGLRKKWFLILLALAVVLIVGLGAGLGAGLGTKKSSSSSSPTATASASPSGTAAPSATANSEYLIGGALNSDYYSTMGAFNGSGIALASQSFDANDQGSLVMYFQHWTGQIRWQQLSSTGDWIGGSSSQIVATDAKNGTPISAVAYAMNGTSTWHIFYIDTNNTVKQRSNNNQTFIWVDGIINGMNLVANDADQVGLQACWYGSDYGDSDYLHTPLPSTNGISNTSAAGNAAFADDVGMHIWYASDDTTFRQLGWRDGDTNWTFQQSWLDMNGHAGVGCYSWGPGTTTYVMFVNTNNIVEFWWKDTNTTLASTDTHPIDVWTNSSISIPGVDPSSSLGYTNYFYAQMADNNMLNGYNITWASENTTINTGDDFTVQGDPGLPGTHLSVSALPNSSGGNSLTVFYQQIGDDVTEYVRDFDGGQWTSAQLPIPNT